MAGALTSFILVLLLAFGLYYLTGIKSGFTPLIAITVMADIALVFSFFDLLGKGVTLGCYSVPVIVFLYAFFKDKDRRAFDKKAMEFFSPAVVLFIISGVFMLIFLAVKQPVMAEWDEFSFWGMSAKLIYNNGALYTYYPSSMLSKSIPPALPVLTYIFGHLNGGFIEWVCYFAYDILLFACFAAVATAFDSKKSHLGTMVFIAMFLLPWFFRLTEHVSFIDTSYISVYSDIPMGVLMGRAAAVCLLEENNALKRTAQSIPVLIFLTLCKDMGLALGCIAAFMAFFGRVACFENLPKIKIKELLAACLGAAAQLMVIGLAYFGWSAHLARAMSVDRSDFGGSSGMGMAEMIITGFKQLFSHNPEEKFATVKQLMISAFFNTRVSMLGSGLKVMIFITGIFALAFLLGGKKDKLRRAFVYIRGVISFVGYYVFHLFLYVYVFRNDAYSLVSYDRYMYTFYCGFMMAAVRVLARAAAGQSPAGGRRPRQRALAGVCCVFVLLFARYAARGNLFTAYDSSNARIRKQVEKKVRAIENVVSSEDVIYLHTGEDEGFRWFIYTFVMSDNVLAPQHFIWLPGVEEEDIPQRAVENLREFFTEYKVTHFLVDFGAGEFWGQYMTELFDTPMEDVGKDKVAYYKVNYTDDGGLYFALIEKVPVVYN